MNALKLINIYYPTQLMWNGLTKTIMIIFIYKIFLGQLPDTFQWAGIFILLVTPLVLFFTLRKLVITHWENRLPVIKILLSIELATLLAGFFVSLMDYIVLVNRLTIFGFEFTEPFQTSYVSFLLAYLKWYSMLGFASMPIIYGLLRWQFKNSR